MPPDPGLALSRPPGPLRRPPAPPRGGPRARSHWLARRRAGPLCDVTISCRKVPICAGERRALGRTAGSAPAPHRHRTGTTSASSAARGTQGRPGGEHPAGAARDPSVSAPPRLLFVSSSPD
ncbi:hypothetical protein DV515_00013645 [Chloebia gouldiae]|uniref:Uncharacterized protein n=1 Tax=Chloebia gouldiae TaxID=44316 RepID=A0A3L8S0H0_CHLGU|nr:hypothetical protein DV515_00013645 [Chloebia gouldiae]